MQPVRYRNGLGHARLKPCDPRVAERWSRRDAGTRKGTRLAPTSDAAAIQCRGGEERKASENLGQTAYCTGAVEVPVSLAQALF